LCGCLQEEGTQTTERGNILSTMYLSGKCVEVILDLNISDSSRSTVVVVVKVVVQLVTFPVEEVVVN
jgi:hypothetical protein